MFQPANGRFDVFLPLAGAAAHPVVFAQLVQHGAANALACKGLKLHALAGFKARQRIGQANHAHLDEVIQFHIRRKFGNHVLRNATHQRGMLANQCIAVQLAMGGVH